MLLEYEDVFSRLKFHFSEKEKEWFVGGMEKVRVKNLDVLSIEKSGMPLPDESDRIFYDMARFCGAYLITGNIKHYPAESFIVTPAQFLGLLGS